MSNSKEGMVTVKSSKSGNKLVDAILAVLKLDDQGKTEKFINKTIKDLDREVITFERQIVNLNHNWEGDNSLLEESLEDLKQSAEDTYTNISMDNIKTNEAANSFRKTYIHNIRTAENNVKVKQKSIEDLKEKLDKRVEDITIDIDIRKAMILKLKG